MWEAFEMSLCSIKSEVMEVTAEISFDIHACIYLSYNSLTVIERRVNDKLKVLQCRSRSAQ
jgi:hypothetical protein